MDTPIAGVGIGVISHTAEPVTIACRSGICLILQGVKQMIVGDQILRYNAGNCFTSLIELPTTKSTIELAYGRPYVATSLVIDVDAISELLSELPTAEPSRSVPAFAVTIASLEVLDAWARYITLLDTPEDIRVLGPIRHQELLYRLLKSPHGAMLRQLVRTESRISRIRSTIGWMQSHLKESILIKDLANMTDMSVPSFNRNFREVTSMSPLQYQKTLRLQAARRLLAVKADVADAAYSVGYESASQFSREYSRLFGISPRQDAVSIKVGGLAAEMI
jgi:AraC-like DNA-binding protein